MPTSDECKKIAGIKADIPLARAEGFLYTLASIPELDSSLNLLRFNFSFQQAEEVCVCVHVCVCVLSSFW